MRVHVCSLLLLASTACARFGGAEPGSPTRPQAASVGSSMLVDAADQPALFLGPDPDAPRLAFVSADVPLIITGAAEQGRVPVRIDGALRVRGYVPVERLALRVQRRGRLRGAPVYLGPNDLVRTASGEHAAGGQHDESSAGELRDERRTRVRAVVRVGESVLGPYEGSYPTIGLSAARAPAEAQPPEPGRRSIVPAGVTLELLESPEGAHALQLPPQAAPYEVRVLGQQERWLAVRAGSGPYVIGWTASLPPEASAQATAEPAPAGLTEQETAAPSDALPARIAAETGVLKRVVAGAKVGFGERVVAVFKKPGWARVLHVDAHGFADVFAAADDHVAIRGLVRTDDLRELSERSTQAEGR